MSVTVVALFVILSFILVFQIYSTVVSFRKNKLEQTDLNYTNISIIVIPIVSFLGENYILSVIAAIMGVLIMARLIFSFIYFTYFTRLKKNKV